MFSFLTYVIILLFQPINVLIEHTFKTKVVLQSYIYIYIYIYIYSKCEKNKLTFCLFGSLISKYFISLNDKILLGAHQPIYYFSGFGG